MWASQLCVQTDADLHCQSCYYWSQRAFVLCWFAVLFGCFANYLSYLVQSIILHLYTTARVSNFHLDGWGELFVCKDPMEKQMKAHLVLAYTCSF